MLSQAQHDVIKRECIGDKSFEDDQAGVTQLKTAQIKYVFHACVVILKTITNTKVYIYFIDEALHDVIKLECIGDKNFEYDQAGVTKLKIAQSKYVFHVYVWLFFL